MKKYIKVSMLLMVVLLFTGCGKKVTTNCSMKSDQSASGYILTTDYKVTSSNDIVTKVETTETVTSKNNTILTYFEKQFNNQYKAYNDTYGGYTYKVTNEKGKVVAKVTIDYKKMNLEKFVKDNSAMQNYVNKENKITLSGIKTMYQSIGAKCEK